MKSALLIIALVLLTHMIDGRSVSTESKHVIYFLLYVMEVEGRRGGTHGLVWEFTASSSLSNAGLIKKFTKFYK